MPLPVTRGEFNRLGDRLSASDGPSETDLKALAKVLDEYQDVLERVKAQLRELGFAPAGRVKTTTTMIEKLRRTPGGYGEDQRVLYRPGLRLPRG